MNDKGLSAPEGLSSKDSGLPKDYGLRTPGEDEGLGTHEGQRSEGSRRIED